MDYKVFYRKYRPKNFNELVGQDNIKTILMNSIKLNKIAHAYIFTGPRGTGKTSTAKIFAKTLNCPNNSNGCSCDNCELCKIYNESPDIIEIDAASNNGVEEIRTLRDSVKIAPYNSKYKIYIIDEVHMLSNSAWNAFLKTLEDPPSHVIFILATTEINKIPETVKSRCQRFDFAKIPDDLLINHLSNICRNENIKITEGALKELSKLSNGCLRDALSYLDKVSKFDEEINEELIENNFGMLSYEKLNNLYSSIKNSDIESINDKLDEISNTGITPINFINDFVNFLLNKIINKDIDDYNEIAMIKKIINKLNNLISNLNSIINPFILIKVELISINYFPGNKDEIISQNNTQSIKILKEENKPKKENKIVEKKEDINITEPSIEATIDSENLDNISNLKNIRVNNSFVGASKDLKSQFKTNWESLLEDLNLGNDYKILGFTENANIEVVSSTNVIFSLKSDSETIIFNNNIVSVEDAYNKHYNSDYKFIGLSKNEWTSEKNKFIKNKNKDYKYIKEESNIEPESAVKNIAEDLFGDNIVEIR